MSDMDKCATYTRRGDVCEIKCNLGLWAVSGEYGLALINEAFHYFEQYKADGEYSEILGGKSSLEIIKERLAGGGRNKMNKSDEPRYSYKMSTPETKYGRVGHCYFIMDKKTDHVISCWAVGSKVHVEKLAVGYVDSLNSRHDKLILNKEEQKRAKQPSRVIGQKLKGIERA
ncbi:hypothetical protein KAR91_47875 [Candidatus Pacearchaeota archaeon]|nr:hypothetical protein [Candidatus Pacearchaeota archaeon]